MFESWHDRDNEETRFWLQFQVLSDGLEDRTHTATYYNPPSPSPPSSSSRSSSPSSLPASSSSSSSLSPSSISSSSPPPPSSSSSSSPSSFPYFPYLPPEIRLKVWECLIQPRVVIAACFGTKFREHKAAQLARRPRRPAVPVLLHVCHEARQLALRHYEPAFAWKIPHRLLSGAVAETRTTTAAAAGAGGNGTGSGVLPDQYEEARVWFNFRLDALFLLGELEPYDRYGFNSPMVYFLRREDTRRVRQVACAFEELHLGVYESEQIFGCLFHIVDRFPAAERLLITSTPSDLEVWATALPSPNNVIQKLWWGWINGTSIVTSSLADTQMLMIREDELASFVTEHS